MQKKFNTLFKNKSITAKEHKKISAYFNKMNLVHLDIIFKNENRVEEILTAYLKL